MTPKTIADYGGAKVDAQPVKNPTTQLAADDYNREAEDVAQLTRTANRVEVSFNTINAAAPQTGTVIFNYTVWGSGASYYPTIAKTNTGIYTLTYASSYTDGLSVAETVSLVFPAGQAAGSTLYPVQVEVTSASVLTVRVFTSGGVATDGGGGVLIKVWSR